MPPKKQIKPEPNTKNVRARQAVGQRVGALESIMAFDQQCVPMRDLTILRNAVRELFNAEQERRSTKCGDKRVLAARAVLRALIKEDARG